MADVNIDGVNMHYVDVGQGRPIVFLHGIPTSSYLWRHVVDGMQDVARCIAPDLIGMGQSDKPDIAYTLQDHVHYFEQFVDALGLDDFTLVMHGWGSVIGFVYAMRHPGKVNGLAFYESHIRPAIDWEMVSLPVQQLMARVAVGDEARNAIQNDNFFVEQFLPSGVMRRLSEDEMAHYRAPFPTPESRAPLWQYFQDLPLGADHLGEADVIQDYSTQLTTSDIPKLMMYAVPGFITTIDTVQWAKAHLPQLTLVDLGDALHFVQEYKPEVFVGALRAWLKKTE